MAQLDTIETNGSDCYYGHYKSYHSNGQLKQETFYDTVLTKYPIQIFQATPYHLELTENGDTLNYFFIDSVNQEMIELEKYENGQLRYFGKYNMHYYAIGRHILYHENGQINSEKTFAKSINSKSYSYCYHFLGGCSMKWDYPIGTHKRYFENGSLASINVYKDYKKHGILKSWYKNGNIKKTDEYELGVPINTSKEYREDGSLISTMEFHNGKEILETSYYENGNVKRFTELNGIDRGGCCFQAHLKGWSILYNDNGKIKWATFNVNDSTRLDLSCTFDTLKNELGESNVGGYAIQYQIGEKDYSEVFELNGKRVGGYETIGEFWSGKFEEKPKQFFKQLRKQYYPNFKLEKKLVKQFDTSPRELKG